MTWWDKICDLIKTMSRKYKKCGRKHFYCWKKKGEEEEQEYKTEQGATDETEYWLGYYYGN